MPLTTIAFAIIISEVPGEFYDNTWFLGVSVMFDLRRDKEIEPEGLAGKKVRVYYMDKRITNMELISKP